GGGGSARDSIPQVQPQRRFIDEIKSNVKKCRKHENGGVKRISEFPYSGGWAYPPLPALQKAGGLPSVEPFYLKKVFVWVPEYTWDEIEHIPCPHCGGRAQPDGWN
ncbi:unnamed protein product, partial [Laminaria digitata]